MDSPGLRKHHGHSSEEEARQYEEVYRHLVSIRDEDILETEVRDRKEKQSIAANLSSSSSMNRGDHTPSPARRSSMSSSRSRLHNKIVKRHHHLVLLLIMMVVGV